MRAFVLSAPASTAACAAILAVLLAAPLLAVPVAAQNHAAIATGIVRVLNEAELERAPDGSAKVIVLHMPAQRAAALDLATRIESAGADVPALKLAATTFSVATGAEQAAATTIRKQRPASIVAYSLDASIVNRLGEILSSAHIVSITTRKDDVYKNRWAVAVTGRDSILYSSSVMESAGFLPLGIGVPIPPPVDWSTPYLSGLRTATLPRPTRASWVEVEQKMQEALRVRSRETIETIDRKQGAYLPHFYRGMALRKLGYLDRALAELRESEKQEVILDFAPLHQELRKLMEECLAELQRRPGGIDGV